MSLSREVVETRHEIQMCASRVIGRLKRGTVKISLTQGTALIWLNLATGAWLCHQRLRPASLSYAITASSKHLAAALEGEA